MKPTRLECTEGTSRKFWEVSTKGTDLVVRFGRLATVGQSKTKSFAGKAQAEAEAARLIKTKLKSGYKLVEATTTSTTITAKAAKAHQTEPKKKGAGSADAQVTTAIVAWLNAVAKHLKAPSPKVGSLSCAKGIVTATTASGKKIRGKVSAPLSLLAALWRNERKVLERVCLETPGQWNEVVTAIRCEGSAHDRYLDLISALHQAGDDQEARLCWLQANFIDDADTRADPLFRALFPKLPGAAAKVTAHSAAAHLRGRLSLARSADSVDALLFATDLYNFMDDAFDDVAGSGKREADLFAQIEGAIADLARHRELAVRDMARIIRLQFARAAAFAADEPR